MPLAVYVLGLGIFTQGTSEFMLAGPLPGMAADLGSPSPTRGCSSRPSRSACRRRRRRSRSPPLRRRAAPRSSRSRRSSWPRTSSAPSPRLRRALLATRILGALAYAPGSGAWPWPPPSPSSRRTPRAARGLPWSRGGSPRHDRRRPRRNRPERARRPARGALGGGRGDRGRPRVHRSSRYRPTAAQGERPGSCSGPRRTARHAPRGPVAVPTPSPPAPSARSS